MKDWKGVVIAEGLGDPAIIDRFPVYKAVITASNMAIDHEGNVGRWHIYHVKCSKDEIDELQAQMLRGWYAHFWRDDKIIVVYSDRQFGVSKDDRSTWKEAIEHGRAQGIPEDELDFPTD